MDDLDAMAAREADADQPQHDEDVMASPGAAPLTVQSLPYVRNRESVVAAFDHKALHLRRISTASTSTADSSPDKERMPLSLSYSVPSTTLVTNTPRGRPAVDVIATYMNTSENRSAKSDLLRSHAHFTSPRTCVFMSVVCIQTRGTHSV